MANCGAIKWTPEQDAEILRAYQSREPGGCARLAARWGVPRTRVSYRAAVLGAPPLICSKAGASIPRYNEIEMRILTDHCDEPIKQIRARLYRAGFNRSEASVRTVIRRCRESGEIGSRGDSLIDKDHISSASLAANMGVHTNVVQRWIGQGLLKARPRQTDREPLAMKLSDVKSFLVEYPQHWNHIRADKFFLVDVLSYLPKKTSRKSSCAASSTKNRLAAVPAPVTAG